MAETPSKRERQREERRSQILDAALVVFSQKGYHATNVSDVAAQAGVSQGTIYWYFESKDELFHAALLSAFMDIGEDTLGSLSACNTATEKLNALAESMEGLADVAEGLFMLFLGYWSSSDRREESAQIWIDLLKQYKDVVVAIVEEGIGNGEFKPVDAEAVLKVGARACGSARKTDDEDPSGAEFEAVLANLTKRETEVLKLLVKGDQNKVVARKLGISPRTVEVHRSRIMQRLGAKSFAELVRMTVLGGFRAD